MDTTISDPTPAASTVALSPLEQMRAKIHDAEKEFAKSLRTEFEALYTRVSELDGEMDEAHFDYDLRKALGKVLKGLNEIVATLSDGADD